MVPNTRIATSHSQGRRGRGHSAGLSRARIVEAARQFSPDDLTMQGVADTLGVDRAAVHYHVADKAALLELVAEETFAQYLQPTGIAEETTWPDGCRILAMATRDSVLATGQFAFYLRISGSSGALRPAELVLARMCQAGFSLETAASSIYTLSSLAIALSLGELSASQGTHPAVVETGRALSMSPDDNPLLNEIFHSGISIFDEATFLSSINTFIAGLEARLAQTRMSSVIESSVGGESKESGARSRGPYAAGRARREQIITEAVRLFAEHGFEAVTTQAVAAACGISRAGVLHHFPTKDSLLSTVLQVTLGGPEDLRRAKAYEQTPDGIDLLRSIAELSERTQSGADVPAMTIRLAIEAADPSHPAHTFFVDRYREITDDFVYVLRLVDSAGYLKQGIDLQRAAIRLNAMIDGLQVQWLLDHDVDIVTQVKEEICELLTDAGRTIFLGGDFH